jgi:hypothetical protein
MHSQCHGQPFSSPVQSQISSNVHMAGGMDLYKNITKWSTKSRGLKKM